MYDPNIKGKPFLTSWGLPLSLDIYFFIFTEKVSDDMCYFFIEAKSEIFRYYQVYFCDIISNC